MALRRVGLAALIIAALAVLIGLGMWQVERQQWKNGLLAERDARTDAPPLRVGREPTPPPGEMDFRRVSIEGTWRFEDAMLIANRVRSGLRGEEIVAAIEPAEGGPAVLVNLGWAPEGAGRDVLADLVAHPPTTVEGLALDGTGRSARTIPNGSWTGLAPASMGEALGYAVADWYVIAGSELASDPRPGSPLPVDGWYRFHNTTPHTQYALTWFGLAAALVAVAVARFVIAPRRARSETGAHGTPVS